MKKPRFNRKLVIAVNLVLLLVSGTYFFYDDALTLVGRILIVDMKPEASDAIVILAGGLSIERPLQAVDFYNAGVAPALIVTREALGYNHEYLERHGVRVFETYESYLQVLSGFGIPSDRVHVIQQPVQSTIDELEQIRDYCVKKGWRKLAIVTSRFHTRRSLITARFIFGPEFKLTMSGSSYDRFDANNWWQERASLRNFVIEFEKLLLYAPYYGVKSLL